MHTQLRSEFSELLSKGSCQEVLARLAAIDPNERRGEPAYSVVEGVALQMQGNLVSAEVAYRNAIQLSLQEYLLATNNLAGLLYGEKKYTQAIDVIEQYRDFMPNDVAALGLHVHALAELGRFAEAENVARGFLAVVPREPLATRWLIHALWRRRKYLEAIALSSDVPAEQRAENGLGYELVLCLIELDLFSMADVFLSAMLGSKDVFDDEEAWAAKGLLEYSRGNVSGACELFRKGIAKGFCDGASLLNLSMVELLLGDYAQGWMHYHARSTGEYATTRILDIVDVPHWAGESLQGKTLLLLSEQGIGDMVQFVRFVPILEEMGARVVFTTYSEIIGLLRNDPLAREVHEIRRFDTAEIDYQALLMDLPQQLGYGDPQTLPQRFPYLYPNTERKEHWARRLAGNPDFKVGIAWAGNPDFVGDHYRSSSISMFAPLAGMPGISFFGLQKGSGAVEAAHPPEGLRYEYLGDQLDSFEDTAALICALDLVICTDTSIAHVAGALNKPVWVLLSKRSMDWRWGAQGDRCAWYPSARIFRQRLDDEWKLLVSEQVRPALALQLLSGNQERGAFFDRAWRTDSLVDSEELDEGWLSQAKDDGQESAALSLALRQFREAGDSRLLDLMRQDKNWSEKAECRSALAEVSLKRGDEDASVSVWKDLLKQNINPGIGALIAWGLHLYAQNRNAELDEVMARAQELIPGVAAFHFLRGLSFRALDNNKAAIEEQQKCLAFSPRNYAACHELASMLIDENFTEGIGYLQKAVMLCRNYQPSWLFFSSILQGRWEYQAAELVLRTKCDQDQFSYEALLLQARGAIFSGNNAAADAILDKLVVDKDAEVRLQQLHAKLFFWRRESGVSIGILRDLVQRFPDNRELRFVLGYDLLRLGSCAEGWKCYWMAMRRQMGRGIPEWKGEPLVGKRLIVVQDQGQGDVIQFADLFRELLAKGADHIAFAGNKSLKPLLEYQGYGVGWVDKADVDWKAIHFDYQVDQMALPYLLGVDLLRPRHPMPFLKGPTGLLPSWQKKIAEDGNMRVGIVWSGSNAFKQNYQRSTSLRDWHSLWEVDGVSFYSLQKDAASGEAAALRWPLHNVAADCGSWLETMSIILSLDLVITTCTAMAHVAAGLGKKTWVLLSSVNVDFRWGLDRQDCPWYPTVTLFRMQYGESWSDVLQRVGSALLKEKELHQHEH